MISNAEIVTRLLLGALLGGIIGFERQHHGRPAGFRTHLLVCVASALIMVVSEYYHYLASFDPAYVRVDPGRIAAGAITGIGFIGAGVIVKAGVNVHGLTTAACLWIVAAIGLALGGGLYLAAATACVITLVSLWLLEKLERVMPTRFYRVFTVVTEGGVPREREIVGGVEDLGLSVKGMDTEFDCSAGEHTYRMTVTMGDPRSAEELLSKVGRKPFVKRYSLHR